MAVRAKQLTIVLGTKKPAFYLDWLIYAQKFVSDERFKRNQIILDNEPKQLYLNCNAFLVQLYFSKNSLYLI